MFSGYNNFASTPFITDSVYENLPYFLKECTVHFEDKRERDVVLTSCLVMLSSCFSSVKGKYDMYWVSPNLFGFIVAPPASGKGVMKFGAMLGRTIQEDYINANKESKDRYEIAYKKWKTDYKNDKETTTQVPIIPKFPMLFIPGNSSAAAIYSSLDESNGVGIICESEADALTGAIKQDWGNFSYLLRKAFHHEPVSINRKTEGSTLTISEPKLSVLLSGTLDQVPKLIASAQDGLCSRFLFYCYSRELKWNNPTPCDDCPDITDIFTSYSKTVSDIKKDLDTLNPVFKLTNAQFSLLSENFKKKLDRIEVFEGADASGCVFRLALISFKIAMILTILRNMDNLQSNSLTCSDRDIINSLELTDIFFEHTMVMYNLLPKQESGNPRMNELYRLLPSNSVFKRKDANALGQQIGLSERTVGNYLQKLIDGKLLINHSYGHFLKPE